MNEAIQTQPGPQPEKARPLASGPQQSAAAKAQQLSQTAAQRTRDIRAGNLREQALREKIRRLEQLEHEVERRERAQPGGDVLASLSDASWDEIREQLDSLHRQAEHYIREKPTQSVLTAAGIGFILGLLMKR